MDRMTSEAAFLESCSQDSVVFKPSRWRSTRNLELQQPEPQSMTQQNHRENNGKSDASPDSTLQRFKSPPIRPCAVCTPSYLPLFRPENKSPISTLSDSAKTRSSPSVTHRSCASIFDKVA